MRTSILSLSLSLCLFSVYAQEKEKYTEEMISSGEAKKKHETPIQNVGSSLDYATFKRTKAWNKRPTNSTIFSNTKDLDISKIGGRVRSSLVDKDNDISLVAPSGGGLWNFDPTDGSSFSVVNDFGSFMAVTFITQNPNNKQEIIVGTGDELHNTVGNGLFKSTDGGKSFSPIASTNPSNNIDFEYIRFVKYSPETNNTIYLSAKNKLYKSTDAGSTWTKVFTATKNDKIRSLEFLSGTGVIIAVDDQGLFSSLNGDEDTFTILTTGVPSDLSATNKTLDGIVVTSHATNRNIAYALFTGTAGNHIYKTINGGTSWTKKSDPSFYITQTWFCLMLGVHPTNPDILVGGSVGFGYSEDGGVTWNTAGGFEVDFHDAHFHSSNPDVAYIGYDQGIGRIDFANDADYWSWNGQEYVIIQQPQQDELGKNPGFNTSQIYYGDYFPESYGDAYIMGQQDGGSFAKVNGQERRILVGDGGSMFVNKQDPTKAFGSTQLGNLKKTSNAIDPNNQDRSGDYVSIPGFYNNHPNWITQFAGNNADGNQIYISKQDTLVRTLDGGNTFTPLDYYELEDVKVAVEESLNPVVYAMGYNKSQNWNSTIIRIENAASNNPTITKFEELLDYNTNRKLEQIYIDPNDKNAVYVTSTNGQAYKVSELNTSNPMVTSIKGDITDANFNVVIGVKGEADLLFAGTNTGLFYSEDAGTSWTLYGEIPYTQVSDLKFRDSDKRLFVFTYGRGAWATTLDRNPLSSNEIQNNQISVTSFPNPAQDQITFSSQENYNVVLFDVKGNKILTTKTNESINLSTVTPGVYIAHIINSGSLLQTEKIVIE